MIIFDFMKRPTVKKTTTKSWTDKVNDPNKQAEVKVIDKKFADIPAGGKMLIATPAIIDQYVRQLPKGKAVTVQTLRNDLAIEHGAEYTCPVTTGIFLRIVSEAAHEQLIKGKSMKSVAPFWRVVDEKSPLNKKFTFGASFVKQQRKKEGI